MNITYFGLHFYRKCFIFKLPCLLLQGYSIQ